MCVARTLRTAQPNVDSMCAVLAHAFLLRRPRSLLSLQHYAAFDHEGWVVGEAVSANMLCLVNKLVGIPCRIVNSIAKTKGFDFEILKYFTSTQ